MKTIQIHDDLIRSNIKTKLLRPHGLQFMEHRFSLLQQGTTPMRRL